MQEVEGRAKQIYVFVEVQQEVQKEKSITIYNSGNLDNSVTMKEENLYPVIQLSANVTWVFQSYAKYGSNLKALSSSPAECALLSH